MEGGGEVDDNGGETETGEEENEASSVTAGVAGSGREEAGGIEGDGRVARED